MRSRFAARFGVALLIAALPRLILADTSCSPAICNGTPPAFQTTSLPAVTVSDTYQVFTIVVSGSNPDTYVDVANDRQPHTRTISLQIDVTAGSLDFQNHVNYVFGNCTHSGKTASCPVALIGLAPGTTTLPIEADDACNNQDCVGYDSFKVFATSTTHIFPLTVSGGGGSSPLTITTPAQLPDAAANEPYPPLDLTASGGALPYQWTLAAGSALPPNLTLSQSGKLSGTPQTASDTPYTFTVQVTDSAGATATQIFTLRVTAGLVLSLSITPNQITPFIPANCSTAGTPAGTASVNITATDNGQPAANLVVQVDLHVVWPSGGHPHMTEMSQDDADALLVAPLVQATLPAGCANTFPLCTTDAQGNLTIPVKAGQVALDLTAQASAAGVSSTMQTLQIRLTGLQDLQEPNPQSPLFYFDLDSHTGVGQSGPEQDGKSGDIVLTNFVTTLAQNVFVMTAFDESYQACQSSLLPIKISGMSLPYGGIFDACWNGARGCTGTYLFQPPQHVSHRQGNDVDIGMGIIPGIRPAKVDPKCRHLLEKEIAAASNMTATLATLVYVEVKQGNYPGNEAASHWHVRLPLANTGRPGFCKAQPSPSVRPPLRKKDTPAAPPGSVQVQVSLSGDAVNYSYQYSAGNLLPSGDIDTLAIPSSTSPAQLQSPTGWSGSALAGGGVHWGATQLPDVPPDYVDDGGMLESPAVIATAATLSGFSFLSPMPPTLTTYNLRTWQPLASFASEDDLENNLDSVPGYALFQGPTLSPRSSSDSPAAIVADLIAISNQCMDLGWIADPNVIQSLQSLLNTLLADLNAGANGSLLADANALLSYTTIQQSSMSPEAFAVFNFNASYLVNLINLQTPPVAITTASLPSGQVGVAYRQQLNASGGAPPYSWGPYGNALAYFLPPGLTGSSDGVISGVPTQAGTFTVQINLTDSAGARTFKNVPLTINPAPLTITTSSLPSGQVGIPYRQSIIASGGTPPYSWGPYGHGIGNMLPPGLTGSSDGVISGTPTEAGTNTFEAHLTDSAGASISKNISLTIISGPLTITTSSLPSGQVQMFYSQTVTGAGGTPPYSWTFGAGAASSLPPGLYGTSVGVISGIPTTAGTYTVQMGLSDSAGARASKNIPLTISPVPLTITTASLPGAKVGQFYSVTVSATGGAPPYTFQFGSGIGITLPPGLNGAESGIISGIPTSSGNFSVQITVVDSAGTIRTKAVNLSVSP